MATSNEEREKKIAEIYHSNTGLPNVDGVSVPNSGDEIVHGDDDRKDVFRLDESEALQRRLVDSTVILTDKDDLSEQDDGTFRLTVRPFRRAGRPPCVGERFGNQHTGGWCSGFMVGCDVIVTAGHCGESEAEIKKTAYVFGFRVQNTDDPGTTVFNRDQVYFGKELIAHDLSNTGDFAVVRVDRKITAPGAKSLPVRSSGSISVGKNLGVIGHPSGLPVKVAFGADTVVMRSEDPWLFANLDTYGGNSGSAVFNADGLVEGILVRGARDYNIDTDNQCFLSNTAANAAGSEAVTKASVFVNHIPAED